MNEPKINAMGKRKRGDNTSSRKSTKSRKSSKSSKKKPKKSKKTKSAKPKSKKKPAKPEAKKHQAEAKSDDAPLIDMSQIKAQIEKKLKSSASEESTGADTAGHIPKIKKSQKPNRVFTGVPGMDELFDRGIPKGNAVLLAGGAGSGKTILCLQILMYHAFKGHTCFYMSFEESEPRLIAHMKDFGWNAEKAIKAGTLRIKRYSPFDITRSVEAMLAKEKGELLIDLEPVILPKGFKPDIVVVDSLTAVASAFSGKEDSYRIYIEQLFRFFEKMGSTSFLITETKQIPEIFSTSGVEEFLADGVIVLYNLKRGNIRENAIEILKMRGEKHQKKIVAMQITENGIVVYPDQEVFSDFNRND